MLNYTYIFYKKPVVKKLTSAVVIHKQEIIPDKVHYNEFYKIILKYHYPLCLNINNILTEEEIANIKKNEPKLIKDKINVDYSLFIIPRILYDLLNFLAQINLKELTLKQYHFRDEFKHMQYKELCNYIDNIHQEILEDTYILNNYILNYILNYNKINLENIDNTFIKWKGLLNHIIINLTSDIDLFNKNRKPLNLKPLYLKSFEQIIFDYNFEKNIEIFEAVLLTEINFNEKKTDNIILYKSSKDNIEEATEAIEGIYFKNSRKKLTRSGGSAFASSPLPQLASSPQPTLASSLQSESIFAYSPQPTFASSPQPMLASFPQSMLPSSIQPTFASFPESKFDSKSMFTVEQDNLSESKSNIFPREYNQGFSHSYNTSILSALFFDKKACTYYLMVKNNLETKKSNYKLKYTLPRFFMQDKEANDVFYIPPLHPYILLYASGEFFHPRSKIFNNSKIKEIRSFANLYDSYDETKGDKFPDYLLSKLNMKDFNKVFKHFTLRKTQFLGDKETFGDLLFHKYLKYKNKYINLQKYHNKHN